MDRSPADQTEDEAPAATPFRVRVRDVFAFRRPAEAEAEAEADQAPEPETPPVPDEPPTIPAQPASGGGRLPAWWEPKKDIGASASPAGESCKHPNPRTFRLDTGERVPFWCPDCATELHPEVPDAPRPAAPRAPASAPAEACEHPDPHEVRAKPTGTLVAYWCADCETQLDVPADYDELEDIEKEDGEGNDEDGGTVPTSIRQRWSIRGHGKTYSRPVYGKDSTAQKKSLIDAWTGMPKKTRHLLYNGTALAAGYYLGVPQFFTDEVAYLVTAYGSWTDFYVCIWYGVAVGIWVLDFRTRGWFPVFSWATRIPLVSMIVGVLLYGNPAS